jgi:Galactose mutarotase and related enzymes
MKQVFLSLLVIAIVFSSCKKEEEIERTSSGLNPTQFVEVKDNVRLAQLHTLTNANGMEVCVSDLGMRILSIMVPDRNGDMKDVVLGFDNLEPYKATDNYFGAILGRYANRIKNGTFSFTNGLIVNLRKNPGSNHCLHGGPEGFHTKYFKLERIDDSTLKGEYLSPNKEEGFPGDLQLTVTYALTNDNALEITYEAISNQSTVVNISNHSYFNLSGDLTSNILDHQLFINADNYTPTNEELIPTGEIAPVKDTPLDFTLARPIGEKIKDDSCPAIKYSNGYDINYVLMNTSGDIKTLAAKVYSPVSGIGLEVYTTEPGVQLYTSNQMNITGKFGQKYGDYGAFCLETQHFPDSPNKPNFPSTILIPGEMYYSQTIYRFCTEN